MSEADTLRSMVLSFRMSELHTLLVYAGKSKSGRKTEIQVREVLLFYEVSLPPFSGLCAPMVSNSDPGD